VLPPHNSLAGNSRPEDSGGSPLRLFGCVDEDTATIHQGKINRRGVSRPTVPWPARGRATSQGKMPSSPPRRMTMHQTAAALLPRRPLLVPGVQA
jgi:hypothetical protein